jgi:hypothetical protein
MSGGGGVYGGKNTSSFHYLSLELLIQISSVYEKHKPTDLPTQYVLGREDRRG